MRTIKNLSDALAELLRGLFDGERALEKAIEECSMKAASHTLRKKLENHAQGTCDKILKLERVFNYLLTSPTGKRNYVVRKMINETRMLMRATSDDSIRDIMLVSCLQSISNYKISGYQTALALALDEDLGNVADLLQEILEEEIETEFELNRICKEIIYTKQTHIAHDLID